jgi:hypothetical protein
MVRAGREPLSLSPDRLPGATAASVFQTPPCLGVPLRPFSGYPSPAIPSGPVAPLSATACRQTTDLPDDPPPRATNDSGHGSPTRAPGSDLHRRLLAISENQSSGKHGPIAEKASFVSHQRGLALRSGFIPLEPALMQMKANARRSIDGGQIENRPQIFAPRG